MAKMQTPPTPEKMPPDITIAQTPPAHELRCVRCGWTVQCATRLEADNQATFHYWFDCRGSNQ